MLWWPRPKLASASSTPCIIFHPALSPLHRQAHIVTFCHQSPKSGGGGEDHGLVSDQDAPRLPAASHSPHCLFHYHISKDDSSSTYESSESPETPMPFVYFWVACFSRVSLVGDHHTMSFPIWIMSCPSRKKKENVYH